MLPMSNRDSLLALIDQLPEETLSPLLLFAQSLQPINMPSTEPLLDLKAMLSMPQEQRNRLLIEQSSILAKCFRPGTEEMAWTEDYIEDNWDDR
jgi:hypothetical protein